MSGPTDFLYNNARQLFATAQINWPAETVYCMLVSQFYAPLLSQVTVSEIPASAIIVRDVLCSNPLSHNGICSVVIPPFEGILAASPVVAVILYLVRGDDTTSPLVYYSSTGSGFPFLIQGFEYKVGYDIANGGFFQV